MRKAFLTLLTVVMFVSLIAIALPVNAGPPQHAEGIWQWTSSILETRDAGCNEFLTIEEDAVWTGTFDGTSREEGVVVVHCSGNKLSYNVIVNFEQVTVEGKSGTLVMSVNATRFIPSAWLGRWVIIGGTGELENLRGQGTFQGKRGTADYEGDIHFEPSS